MAFNFVKAKSNTNPISNHPNSGTNAIINNNHSNISSNNNNGQLSPSRLVSLQSSKTAIKQYPAWLRDTVSCLKQLPGIYHGVLGQVQLQPSLVMSDNNKFTNGLEKLVKQHQKTDYLNRFTDTERVHQLLSTSRLSNEHLATIWAHVNKTFPGQLTNREVCLALALIAIFQRLEKEDHEPGTPESDPFALVKLEKKAPVPILYPREQNESPTHSSKLPASSSMPNDLALNGLLIDIASDVSVSRIRESKVSQLNVVDGSGNALNLIDMDSYDDGNFQSLAQVWSQMMVAMKGLYKRSFDILNVENGREGALEALRSPKGVEFCKQLCLCYPIAHNINWKVDELNEFKVEKVEKSDDQFVRLFDKTYSAQINELMISINEYWAVLINLFHESGQTNFIELIMDGLNRSNRTVISETMDGLRHELETFDKPNICAICLTKFYLVNIGDALGARDLPQQDIELVLANELLSDDEHYYYHARCANFWLNNVQPTCGRLPFSYKSSPTSEILKPTSL